jgi:hypothetical protein
MEKKLLHLQKAESPWSLKDKELAMQANFIPYILLLSETMSEKNNISNFYNEYINNVNGNVGRSVITESPSVIFIRNGNTAEEYCSSLDEILDKENNNIYIFFLSEKYSKLYPLSFLDHDRIVKIIVPNTEVLSNEVIELLEIGEQELKKKTHTNCA